MDFDAESNVLNPAAVMKFMSQTVHKGTKTNALDNTENNSSDSTGLFHDWLF
jgi:hypothetical protein